MRSKVLFLAVVLVAFIAVAGSQAQQAVLSVRGGSGTPGSVGNLVQIDLDNTEVGDIYALQFDLGYDSKVLSIANISRTVRTDSSSIYDVFEWRVMTGGIVRFAIVKIEPGIMAGTGSIADIFFDVDDEAVPGEYPLVLSNVILADCSGIEVSVTTSDGIFIISGGTGLRVVGTSGSPGSEGNEVSIRLYNEKALSELSFTLNFDSAGLSLRNVLPTDRTQQLDHFDWSLPDPGRARLSIQGSEGQTIPFGSGAIASFLFSVATQVYSGQYLLTLSEVSARDSVGETVNVISSDGTFTVYGGIEPDIDLSESRHDFYEVLVGDTASWDLTIYNRGRSDLDVVTITSSSAEFRPLGQQFHRIIPPGDSLDVTVTFTPTDEGQKEGALTIYCNDPDEPEQSVSLKGTGILEGKVLLSVEDKAGYPGHKDLPVPVKLDNTVRIRECSFALNYDTTSIAFTYVGWMERVASMPRRCSEPSPGKVEVFLSDTTDRMIQPGSGPILYICFDILGRALPGVTPVTLSDILFLRADGDTLDVDTEDGEVRVLEAQPDIVVPDTSHNFGYCLVGDTVRWDLAFYNKGHGNLTVDSVVTDDSCFAIERASFPQNIFSGESLPVTVIFTPQAEGSVSTLLFVFSNDPDEEQVILTLYGHGLFEPPALLTLSEGAGLPGDSGAVVALHLSNSIDIALVELDLLFDTASLVVLDVQRTPRTSSLVLEIFDWASTEDGIRIAISGTDRFIPIGAGDIAELVFKVASDTAPNQYPLRLENIIVSDPSGFELPWRAEDGSFTVAAQAALRIGNSSGAPGSADNVVPIELMNERALSRLQFTVHYPDSVMRWSKIVATGRLLNGTVIHTDYQEGMLSLNIESPEGGTIPAGSGRILELWFHVGINAASGLYALHLSGATASDSVGVPVEVSLLHGNFTVGFGDIDLSAYEHDFGEVSLGDTAFWSFTMFNRGWIDLKVFDIVSSDPNFIVILPLFPETVLAGSQLPVVVAFAPTELGSSAGTLAVLSDDPDEETLFVRLSGSAKEPHIELSVNEIDFGDVEVCASIRRTFTISNVGVGDLIVTSLSSDNPAFRVTSPSFPQSIAAGSEIDVVVVFSPDRLDMYSGTIEISSDDPDEPLILLPVTGRGVFGEPSLRVGKTYGMFSDTNWVSVSLKNDRPVSQVHFSVNYDDNCLIPLDVVPTSRTAPLSHLSFQELEPGRLSVHLADDGGRLIGQGSGEILNLGFEWRPGECDSNLRVNLSDVSVLDDLNQEIDIASEDGKFFVVPFEENRLFVGDASFDGVMPLILSNVTSVAALQADLLFDTTILRVKEVKKTPRSLYFGIFSWSCIDRGIRVAMTSEHYFGPGVGSIADMTFERLQTPPSCSVPVIVSNVVLADPLGTEIPVTMGQGTFVASGEARLKAGDGSGFPGDAERAITIFLSNTLDAASIEFDLGYDSDVLQVTQTLPTSRTGHMGLFQWQELVPGSVHVSISDDAGGLIGAGDGPVAELLFDVKSDAPGGTYSLTLSHVILLDARNAVIPTWAESGTFMVVSGGARLSIGQASGSPGSSDIIIPIDLYNAGSEVAAMQFDLNFDTDALQVTGVAKTDRTANMDIFSYSSTSNGIRMAATGIGHSVPPGTGPVANVTFEVSNNAAPGTYWMDLSGVVLADPLGNEIEVLAEGNWFTVTEETEVQLSQFSAECRLGKVFIEWTIGGYEDLIKFSLHRDVNQDGNYIKIHETDFRAEQKTYHFRDERIDREGLYTYELKVTNVSGRERVLGKTSVQVRDLFPQDFALEQNYPNPFNPATTIRYALPDVRRRRQDARQAPFFVSLKIYNILGQEARTLVNGHQEPGYYTVIWDGLDERGSAVPCGVYFYRLAVGSVDWSQTKRMVLLR